MLVKHYTTYICFCVIIYVSTWSLMLIIANISHSYHWFIATLSFFYFWYVSTLSWQRFLVVSQRIWSIYKRSLLWCLHFRYFEFFDILIFIEVSNLHRVSVLIRIFFEYILIVFDRCLISMIELSWVIFDCLNILCIFCLCTRSQ